ncbi:hypothetical protein HD554DRAFT_2316040 [Boletus coccyginus]|nr:hypothetical protein HD554DRAFT_2316040 [Boletus coccyginus]
MPERSSKLSTKIILHRIALRPWLRWLGRPALMVNLADLLYTRFEQWGAISDLDEALALQRGVLQLYPQGHPHRATSLHKLACLFYARFEQLGSLSDLDEALALEHNCTFLERNTLELRPQGHPDRAHSLNNLASSLHSRFQQFGLLFDLDEALSLARNALELRPQGHPCRAISLCNLARYLHSRFRQLGSLSDLDEALALERNTLELCPQRHPDRAPLLSNLASSLYSRFEQLGTLSDLDEAVALGHNVLELRPQGHPDRALSLYNLVGYLHSRFEQLGSLFDLDVAVALQRNALELYSQGHPHRAPLLDNLASSLHSRFQQLGTLSDLDEAVLLHRNALELCPQGHPNRIPLLNNLANSLHSRFKQLGALSDLDEVLALARNALELCPHWHPNRTFLLNNLANSLHARFEQLGSLSDLDEALALQRNTLELRPQGHPDRFLSLSNLASSLHSRFEQRGSLSDLDEALSIQRNALELRLQGHPDRFFPLGNLANCLYSRFQQLETLSDLEEAVALQRNALELCSRGHPGRPLLLANLAHYLHSRFQQLGTLSDLDEAIALVRNALELHPQGHPDRPFLLTGIAVYLHVQFKHSTIHDISGLQEIYSQLCDISQTVSFVVLKHCKLLIQAAEECEHSMTVLAYQASLHLIVQYLATLPSLPQHLGVLKQITASTVVDGFSASIRYGNLANAVELLEQGRSIFWSQLTRIRSPLDEVIAFGDTGKKLAAKFTQLASLLRHVLDASSSAESQHDRACCLNIQLQGIITDIRKLPGLSRFLQPPLFSDLQNAAAGGPVVIVNASQYSCDALIVLPNRDPVHIALPITKVHVSELSLELRFLTSRARFRDVTKELMVLLRELWDMVVFPIVKILQECFPNRSRIWWCPTAEFSLLPLHAAGSFRKGQPIFSELYISSYTPTLTALMRARQKRLLDPSIERHRFLVVGQAQAPGQSKLVGVNAELSSISQRIRPVATLTCIHDQDANIAKVAEELATNEFVHLACHGIPDRKHPFESGFALGDRTIKACHTTVGDEESPDEAIHLAAAMQFAGFRSVIGTMWAVDDAHTNEITSRFYNYMVDERGRLDHTRAALALHRTMSSLRSSEVPLESTDPVHPYRCLVRFCSPVILLIVKLAFVTPTVAR